MDDAILLPAHYYQHFDADFEREVPEEGFGGWKKKTLPISRAHTAVVCMHAWNAGKREEFPGWYRAVPYIPRSQFICENVFPELLKAVRASSLPLFHVVGGGVDYYKSLPGYKHAVELAGPEPTKLEHAQRDPILEQLSAFRDANGFPGTHNNDDIKRGFERLGFAPQAQPLENEGIAENGHQLAALCREKRINHLIYCGFAINWCLLVSPGGMAEMQRYGIMCSALRQATTAVENGATARFELCKEIGLWRVSLAFGFVFDVDDFVAALKGA